ncbi:MAG: hypothetical protein KDI03_16780, partial [Anaerolineae bacterium]|nr:hypothetical protein [Anaerolineae bacterium]
VHCQTVFWIESLPVAVEGGTGVAGGKQAALATSIRPKLNNKRVLAVHFFMGYLFNVFGDATLSRLVDDLGAPAQQPGGG